MFLVCGLGNPGNDYARNRHNIGFMAIDEMALQGRGPAWKKKFKSLITETTLPNSDIKIIFLKPQTYMNLSGEAVREAMQFYKIPIEKLFVFHDEIDLPPAKIKIKQGGGAGGHNGIKSIDAHCGNGFWRVRIGVGHPGQHIPDKGAQVSNYVLSDFAKADKMWLDTLLPAMAEKLPVLLNEGAGAYLTKLNGIGV